MSHKKRRSHPAVQAPQIQTQVRNVSFAAEMYAGPLPHPDTLRAYNEIVPGAAGMILDKFAAQTDHRRDLEARVVKANIWQTFLGQVFAFILLLFLIGGGGYLIYSGRNLGGLGTIVAAVCAAVVVFIKGRSAKQTELETKRGPQR